MRIATWNVNSLRVRMEHLGRWLAEHAVDAIALQELKLTDEQFPQADFEAMGLHAVCYGQKTYNGVAIAARRPPADVTTGIPGDADPQRRVIAAPSQEDAAGPERERRNAVAPQQPVEDRRGADGVTDDARLVADAQHHDAGEDGRERAQERNRPLR
mgnify:CR=1 FL=1